MGKRHFSEEQIAFALRQAESGTSVADIMMVKEWFKPEALRETVERLLDEEDSLSAAEALELERQRAARRRRRKRG